MENTFDCIVIGGGQAGLASSYYLKKWGLKYLILEATEQVAGSWQKYYDGLTLFSPARYSSLPSCDSNCL
ncbi:NAD(P)-binding domain-containing protein [Bacillus sp. ISL-7]|uniref:NAD(P)-binding domain-containing protein n=1 Tax=Bacillus sp. ISL-7 TaxID=2819136 RepID=UPI0027E13C1C|nr:NAD(P)-binding domain-containing protein [Bacillus sp. ISL-7]